jgi:hypothetical protein
VPVLSNLLSSKQPEDTRSKVCFDIGPVVLFVQLESSNVWKIFFAPVAMIAAKMIAIRKAMLQGKVR